MVLEQFQRRWPGLEVIFQSDDISRPTDWCVQDSRHAVVVHLGGRMQQLETELDGSGGCFGPALPGEVWTAPAGRRYASHACGETIFYALMFLDPGIPGAPEAPLEMMPIAGYRDEFLHQSVRRLWSATKETDDVSELLADSLSQAIRLHLSRAYTRDRASPGAFAAPVLETNAARRLREFIYENLSERLTLSGLSGLVGMTPHHLLIAFRKAFGTTPAQYVIQQRLRQAQRELLEKPRKGITAIALDAGFSSHSHLTSSFGRFVGCSPSAFRSNGRSVQ